MDEISAKEWELLSFFEGEPERQGLDSVWLFDDSVYKADDGTIKLTCAIHPYHRDIRLMLWKSEKEIYEYSAMGIKDVSVSVNTLNILVSEEEIIYVTIRPEIGIKHERKSKT